MQARYVAAGDFILCRYIFLDTPCTIFRTAYQAVSETRQLCLRNHLQSQFRCSFVNRLQADIETDV